MIKFLGTAGARYVVSKQLRSSAGIFLTHAGKKVVIDPGPGTLVRLAKSRPRIDAASIDALMLTHVHIDHSCDVNVLIDGMTSGGHSKRGELFAPAEALEGERRVVLKYLRGFLDRITVLKPEQNYRLGELEFQTSASHEHGAETYGFKFKLGREIVSLVSDTKFSPRIMESYKNSDVLIVNTVRNSGGNPGIMHLGVEEVKKMVLGIKPRRVYLTHFGLTMLKAGPRDIAESLTRELGVSVIAASDGMAVDI